MKFGGNLARAPTFGAFGLTFGTPTDRGSNDAG
jgi:hypothetical protein